MAARDDAGHSDQAWSQMTTRSLVDQAVLGNSAAIEAICERLRPRLLRWAHGRLPRHARSLRDTEDLVQETLASSLSRLPGFQETGGGLLAYLCEGIRRRVLNEIRNASRRPAVGVPEGMAAPEPPPDVELIKLESLERYRRALAKLAPDKQDLVNGRVELEMSYPELALEFGLPSADAARMAVKRAIRHLAETLADDERPSRADR